MSTQPNAMQRLLDFLEKLDHHKIYYRLSRPREEAIMVEVVVPGERWEVEFFADSSVEVEIFSKSSGVAGDIDAEQSLQRLFERYSE